MLPQAAIERRDDASAGVDAALEALQEARRALQEAGEAEAAAAAGAGGDGDAPPPDAKGSASAAGAPIPIRILESKLVAAEAIKAAAESAATRGVEAVKRADIKMRECETVESDTKLYHHKLLPENAPKKPKSLLDPMEQAVVEAEQTWQKSFRQIAEAKASWLETLQQEMAVYHQKWLQAEVKLGEAKDADTSREQEHAELEAEVEAALEELAKAEGRTAAALEEVMPWSSWCPCPLPRTSCPPDQKPLDCALSAARRWPPASRKRWQRLRTWTWQRTSCRWTRRTSTSLQRTTLRTPMTRTMFPRWR